MVLGINETLLTLYDVRAAHEPVECLIDGSRITSTTITHIVEIKLALLVDCGIGSVAYIVECEAVNNASPGNKTGKSRGSQEVYRALLHPLLCRENRH